MVIAMSMMPLCTTLTEAAVEPSVQSVVNKSPRMTWSTMLCWNMTSKEKIGESENDIEKTINVRC